MAKVMTYAQAIDVMLNVADGKEVEEAILIEAVERMNALKVQLAKRGSGKKGLTKVQKENVALKENIVLILTDEVDGMTATEVGNALAVTCQKASALLRQLIEEQKIEKVKDGKVTRFVAIN